MLGLSDVVHSLEELLSRSAGGNDNHLKAVVTLGADGDPRLSWSPATLPMRVCCPLIRPVLLGSGDWDYGARKGQEVDGHNRPERQADPGAQFVTN